MATDYPNLTIQIGKRKFELLPCPFCGTDNVVLESYKARKGYEAYVQCNGGCMANQHTITYDTLEEAEAKVVEMWNTRTSQKEGVSNE